MRALPLAFLGLLFAACTTRLTDFTVLTTKNVDLSRMGELERHPTRVSGEDAVPIILLPIGIPNVKEAIDRAIDSVPGGVVLVNGVVYQTWFSFVFGFLEYRVEGDLLIDPRLRDRAVPSRPSTSRPSEPRTVLDFSR